MNKEPTDQRVPLMMELNLLNAIDDYRLANKIWSRSDAIRKLIREGLASQETRMTPENTSA